MQCMQFDESHGTTHPALSYMVKICAPLDLCTSSCQHEQAIGAVAVPDNSNREENPHEPFELFSHDSSFSGALLRGNYAVKGIPISRVNVVAGRESLIAHDDMVMDVFRALKNTKVSIFVRTFFSCPFCGLNFNLSLLLTTRARCRPCEDCEMTTS